MSKQLEAIFENGVFRPVEPVELPPQQRVTVTVSTQEASAAAAPQQLDAVGTAIPDGSAEESPWRGVCVLPKKRHVLFTHDLASEAAALPKRKPSVNMNWHRMAADDA